MSPEKSSKRLRISDINEASIQSEELQYPSLLVNAVVAVSALMGKPLDLDNFVYESKHDTLDRLEFILGYEFGQDEVLSSSRFAVYNPGVIRAYGGTGKTEELLLALGHFVKSIHEKLD